MALRYLAGVLVVVAFVALFAGVYLFNRRRRAARDDALGRDAVQRGWRYTTSWSIYGRTRRWEGVGPTGAWTAEAVHGPRRRKSDLHVIRWWNGAAAAAPLAGGMDLLIAVGDGPQPPALSGDGALARVAQHAFRLGLGIAFESHFRGALSIAGRELQRVEADPTIPDGFALLSDQPRDTAQRLTPARSEAISRAFPASSWKDSAPRVWHEEQPGRPWICLCGDRIAIAIIVRKPADIADIVALVEAGSTLARVPR